MSERREIDEAVTRRIAEIASAAGVPHSRISLEVLYYLPKDFLERYIELFNASLRIDSGGVGGTAEEQPVRVSSEYRGKRPMVGAGGKRYKEFWVVRSDDALDLKRRIDKRLRALARDIRWELQGGGGEGNDGRKQERGMGRIRCTRCGRLMGGDWKFCAECGNFREVRGDD